MTSRPDMHVVPIGARGNHRPHSTCPCRPVQAVEMMAGTDGRVVYVHRHVPDVPCSCPGCEALDRELDVHLARIQDGTATAADRERVARLAKVADRPHRMVGEP